MPKTQSLWADLALFFLPELALQPLTLQAAYLGPLNSGQLENHLYLIFQIILYKQREKKINLILGKKDNISILQHIVFLL